MILAALLLLLAPSPPEKLVLARAADILEQGAWTQDALARNLARRRVLATDTSAVAWDATGAIVKATADLRYPVQVRVDACRLLYTEINKLWPTPINTPQWNDLTMQTKRNIVGTMRSAAK